MKQTEKFNISIHGVELPFELYSIDYILEVLDNNNDLFGVVQRIENASKSKIKHFYKENKNELKENTRHFAYIKFFKYKGKCYGIVGGKTNYTNPDLSFDEIKGNTDNRYSRNFLQNKGLKWDETIIIVNHKPLDSEEADKKGALFVECYLQRMFNLFES